MIKYLDTHFKMVKTVLPFCAIVLLVSTSECAGTSAGLQSPDPNSVEIQQIAAYAIDEEDQRSNCPYRHALLHVVKAKTQIDAGIDYFLAIQTVRTDCRAGKKSSCKPVPNMLVNKCKVKVREGAGGGHRQLVKYDCVFSPCDDKIVPGGMVSQNPENSKIQEIANFVTKNFDTGMDYKFTFKLQKVIDAQTQTVNVNGGGTLYYLNLRLTEILHPPIEPACEGCRAASPHNINSYEVLICSVMVLDKPIINQRSLKTYRCHRENSKH